MYRRIMLYVLSAVIGITAAAAVSAVFTVITVSGSAMEPAIEDGSKVLINKTAYAGYGAGSAENDIPKVGDMVAFRCDVYGEEGEGSILVRRIAGSEGDVVEIKDGNFYLNGKLYDQYMTQPVHMEDMAGIKLKDNEIFVLSDNRTISMDSRNDAVGVLNIEDCVGKVALKWRGIR